MATQPKSRAVEEYRRQIALYLQTVQIAKNWKLVRMGEAAGGLAHTSISRALKGEHTLGFPALLALEEASGLPIPEALTSAARQAQQPVRPQPELDPEVLRSVARELEGRSPEEQRTIIGDLLKALTKAG